MDRTHACLLVIFGSASLAYAFGSAMKGAPLGGETTVAGLAGLVSLVVVIAHLVRSRTPESTGARDCTAHSSHSGVSGTRDGVPTRPAQRSLDLE